jgi:hypothetical protein
MRNYLSTHHLYAARYAAEDAQAVEDNWAGNGVFNIRHRGYVLTAVVESVAFLEAAINELYQDSADSHPSYSGTPAASAVHSMAEVWRSTSEGRFDMFEKYDLTLAFAEQERFVRGAAPFQDAALLVRLRNYAVHYRPEGITHEQPHKLGRQLLGKFAGSVLMKDSGNPWFPDEVLGAGCAGWAWRTSRGFADEFTARMNITFNYDLADFRDALPA